MGITSGLRRYFSFQSEKQLSPIDPRPRPGHAMNLHSVFDCLIDHPTPTQFFLFASIIISVWLAEKIAFAEPARVKRLHTSRNALFIVSALPVQISMMLFCLGLAKWTTVNRWGLVYLLPNADSPLIKYGLMFFVLDLLDYVYHSTMHRVPAFWRFHLVHHTDRAVDVSTTMREHPGETLIRNGFLILWVFLCGASVAILILRQTVETVANLFAHTSFRLPPGPARVLGWLFITPNLHHAHHHFQMPATNRNYGDVFSIWDRLFGTFMELAREDTVFGLDTHMDGAVNTGLLQIVLRGRLLVPRSLRSGFMKVQSITRKQTTSALTDLALPRQLKIADYYRAPSTM